MTIHDTSRRSMGHTALHYPKAEDAKAAERLLTLLGFIKTQELPLPAGAFYRFVTANQHHARGDGIVYVSACPPAQRDYFDAVRAALKFGQPDEHPSVAALRAAQVQDPEYAFHLGILTDSLDDLEATMIGLQQAAESDPLLKDRITVSYNRPMAGDPVVDGRLDASPVFGDVTRYAYGRNGVQAFIATDLLINGPTGDSLVIELDYIWPDATNHILSVVEFG
ncbi:MAG: hypothetical protein P0Y52_09460 [Candidatus Brevundimonas phytovorans]|nr:hypothetical protein [Brevundimonas sp.]WEK56777.1 MAG: hypothetical protein P0Y52_09460 [Brevundimonas sp.]